jgi:hypothetical protein
MFTALPVDAVFFWASTWMVSVCWPDPDAV